MVAIALYLRVSLDDEQVDESNSVTNQRDLLTSYIASNPTLSSGEVSVFADDGWSGTNFNRPQVQALLDKARKGRISCIIVKDLSRWGRNYPEVSEYLDNIFPFLGIRFISVNDQYDSFTYSGQTAPTDVAFSTLMHDAYSRELSFKIRQSYNSKVCKGEFLTGSPPFGFIKSVEGNRLEIDMEAAEIVRYIFSLAYQGVNTSQIAVRLNEASINTPLMYRKRKGRTLRGNQSATNERVVWNSTTVRRILIDERYIGVMVGGKQRMKSLGSRKIQYVPESEWIRIPNAHEAIVSKDIFKQANLIIRRCQKAYPTKRHVLFAGKIKCGYCGKLFSFASRASNSYYYCKGPKIKSGHGCFEGRINLASLKDIVLTTIKLEAQKANNSYRMRRQARCQQLPKRTMENEIRQLSSRVTLIENRNVTLFENFTDGKITKDAYISKKEVNGAELEKINARIKWLNIQLTTVDVEQEMNNVDRPILERILQAADVTEEILSLIDHIIVFDEERIEIRFAFADAAPSALVQSEISIAI